MQEIAAGTHNFQQFNEIMPTIWTRFFEKEAREWRQIYKALTLLEYLVKNGSERVVDDARSHVSTIKMLRSFHYVDEKGKDQGINVRNRAKELGDLLGDVDRIRQERRKAKSNRSKYQGAGSDGLTFQSATGNKYGGFGSDTLGGGGGGAAGGAYGGRRDEYDSGGKLKFLSVLATIISSQGVDWLISFLTNFRGTRCVTDIYRGTGAGAGAGGSGRSSGMGGASDSGGRRAPSFDEYDAGEDDDRSPAGGAVASGRRQARAHGASASGGGSSRHVAGRSSHSNGNGKARAGAGRTEAAAPPKQEKVVVDLFDFNDDEDNVGATAAAPASNTGGNLVNDDDEFDDFQTAPTVPAAAPPAASANAAGTNDIFAFLDAQPAKPSQSQAQPPAYTSSAINFGSLSPQQTQRPIGSTTGSNMMAPSPSSFAYGSGSAKPSSTPSSLQPPIQNASNKSSLGGGFDDLWSSALGSGNTNSGFSSSTQGNKSIADLEKERSNASLWGAPAAAASEPKAKPTAGGFDDLLF